MTGDLSSRLWAGGDSVNIFALDENPALAAQFHCDKHVVKMVLETAQILSTVHRKCGYEGTELYRATHANHPCTVWAGESTANYGWAHQLLVHLCREYTARYGRTHATARLLKPLAFAPWEVPIGSMTPFAQAMPEDVRHPDAVTAYRAYYRQYKSDIATWKHSPTPAWWSESEGH